MDVLLTLQRYEQYTERKIQSDAKFKAKRARQELDDGEWAGFSEQEESDDENVVMHDQSSDDESDDEEGPKSLVRKLDGQDEKTAEGLTKRAALFFDQDVFADISEDDGADEDEDEESEEDDEFAGFSDEDGDITMEDAEDAADDGFETEEEDDGFEVVKAPKNDSNWDADDEPMKNGRPGKKKLPTFFVFMPMLTAHRHRHHYCGSHDARTAARQW